MRGVHWVFCIATKIQKLCIFVCGTFNLMRNEMDKDNENLRLTAKEIADAFADPTWAARFPPILTVEQTAEMLQTPRQTIFEWRSKGRLVGCGRRVGRRVRFFRDRVLRRVFNEGLNSSHGEDRK